MQVEPHFENIRQVLIDELSQAEQSIFVAVAWFTDNQLLDCLVRQARKGTSVNLLYLDDQINRDRLNFIQLSNVNGSAVYAYPYTEGDRLMHNKFCVIDRQTVITGSYNWSRKAATNEENIIVTRGNNTLAVQFIQQFGRIAETRCGAAKGSTEQALLDVSKLSKRLKLIKNFILLEEFEDIEMQIIKLHTYADEQAITKIIEKLNRKEYVKAVASIDEFVNQYQQISLYEDPEIFAYRLEIKTLELELTALSNEKAEMEKTVHDFGVIHNRYLGKIIEKILKLRKEQLDRARRENPEKEKEFKEAEEDYEHYHKQFEDSKDQVLYELDEIEKKELKKKFRKASMLCHPDRVSEAVSTQAEQIFVELQTAYAQNDLNRVIEILDSLENNKPFVSRSEKYTEKAKLKAEVQRIRFKLQELEKNIVQIKNTEVWQTIQEIADWDIYFEESKTTLQKQLETLEANGE